MHNETSKCIKVSISPKMWKLSSSIQFDNPVAFNTSSLVVESLNTSQTVLFKL